jgi:hypothetical protein
MAVIRCPHCGKPNPDFLDVCQYCDQPLQAGGGVTTSLPEGSGEAGKPGIIRCPHCGKPNPEFLETCQFCEQPLHGIAATPPGEPAEELPDWLRALQSPEDAAEAERPGAKPEVNNDWYWGGQSAVPQEPLPPVGEPAPEADIPDWLKSMQVEAAPPAPEEDIPDWLKSMPTTTPLPTPPAEPTAQPPIPSDEDIPGWLKAMQAPAEAPPSIPSEEAGPAASTFMESGTPSEELPDWLKSAAEPGATPLPPSVTGPLGEVPPREPAKSTASFNVPDETPDWLRDLGAPPLGSGGTGGTAALSMDAPMPAIVPGPEDTPDFLSPAAPAAEDEAPDWLKSLGISSASAAEMSTEPAASPQAPPADSPDWLKEFTGGTATLPPVPSGPSPGFADLPGAAPAEEPDWLQSLRSEAGADELAAASPFGASVSPFASDLGEVPAAPEEAASALSTPDWLAGLRPAEPVEPAAFEETPTEVRADLAQGELPSWLAAMRPVEVQRPLTQEVDNFEESVGVLSGMKGVLRAEPSVVLPGKSAANVHTLVVTDAHSSQAQLLANLLRQDTEAAPKRRRLPIPAVPWERWLLAVVLVLGMLMPVLVGDLFLLPSQPLADQQAALLTLEQAPNDKPVLVAFDYEPAQNGELRPGAEVVIKHLMRRGVPIVTLSTNLVGSNLAQDIIADPESTEPTLAARYGYSDTVHYFNLGYLPGGAMGIQQFAAAPRAAFRADFAGRENPGSAPIFQRVQTLADFGALVIISATPDDARAWIEQTQSAAPDVPIVFVISAGADPLVRPYFEPMNGGATRVAGVVSGLIGAAHYEQQALLLGPALRSWQALGSGLLTAALILVVGNLVHGVTGVFLRRRKV